jgi:hypothetical protein
MARISFAPSHSFCRRTTFWRGTTVYWRAFDTILRLLARNHFPVARDLGVVERMLRSQVRAAIFTVGLPRPRCTEDTGSGC